MTLVSHHLTPGIRIYVRILPGIRIYVRIYNLCIINECMRRAKGFTREIILGMIPSQNHPSPRLGIIPEKSAC